MGEDGMNDAARSQIPPFMYLILIVLLILILLGALPVFPHSRNWGYAPMGGIGTLLVILLALYLFKVI